MDDGPKKSDELVKPLMNESTDKMDEPEEEKEIVKVKSFGWLKLKKKKVALMFMVGTVNHWKEFYKSK